MAEKMILVDSNIIFDYYNGIEKAKNQLTPIGFKNLCISSITYQEAIFGALNKNDLSKWLKHLDNYSLLKVNSEITDTAIQLMKKYVLSHRLTLPDSLIAATAIHYSIKLFTYNLDDFRYIREVDLYIL